ncbi:MAG: autotransporter-associated beta strand repeat-containing protein [Akkermansia sp.]|nr:autotransporter-associated beta strand repeat-containing protein [Akkermansia sp.]
MKLHLNLSLRRAVLASMVAVAAFASSATAGIVDTRYDLQYYIDFSRNAGMFSAGATNVTVGYKDGSATYTIPVMPYMGSYAQSIDNTFAVQGSIVTYGGSSLVSSQFMYGAAHVFDRFSDIFSKGQMRFSFNDENGNPNSGDTYGAVNVDKFGHDGAISRTDKLVTAVAYTPMATNEFMSSLNSNSWLFRLGNGRYLDSTGTTISTGNNAIGGIINMDSYKQQSNGDWYLYGVFRQNSTGSDPKTPLDTGVYSGDSGSPLYAWDAENEQFVFVGALWASNLSKSFGNDVYARFNPKLAQAAMDKYTVNATFSGTDTIAWNAQNATTGEGTLQQGETIVNYTGKGTGNTMAATKGLSFATESEQQQEIQLKGNINMGAGALTFANGDWKITEEADYTLASAGFEVKSGANLTLELTGSASEEIRKVGEGTLTIAGSGRNEASLVVGGGTMVYDIKYNEDGEIVGCTLGNAGETRLNRQDGYAAGSVRLEGGVAIIVLMDDNQFKTNSVAGDTFTFGNDGGLLNLNGHNLEWGVIQQDASGTGARIGNFTPLNEATPGHATFTYTGSDSFGGCFVDESTAAGDGKAQLAVVYKGAANDSWKLTGNSTNVGGYTVQSGTMVLEGSNVHHVNGRDTNDWNYASIDGSDVTVKNGATFQLSHHAQLVGDVHVENGGSFIMNQAVNADSESISGSAKINMVGRELTSLVGDVKLHGNSSTMTADVQSSAITKIEGNITVADYDWDSIPTLQLVKNGNGILTVTGNVGVPMVQINAGGLVIEQANALDWYQWTIGKDGFLAAIGVNHSVALDYYIADSSNGVFALTYDQESALNLSDKQGLYIGAWGEVHYGAANATLSANNDGNWLLGGGTGTLIVDFKLTGSNDLIIGNENSSGTVRLTNTHNDIKDIYIKGTGNKLVYDNVEALGGATISLSYGNAVALRDASLLEVINPSADGVLALTSSVDLDMTGRVLSIGALGDFVYQGTLTLGEGEAYRFGGSGNLTVDTELAGSNMMYIDGQGTSGSSVTLAREKAFDGDIKVGAGLNLASANSQGDIALHVGHSSALAAANSVDLQKGASLYTDGQSLIVQNLSAKSGSSMVNNGTTNSTIVLYVTEGTTTSIANGVLNDANNTSGTSLGIVKAGAGTVEMAANANWTGGLVIEDGKVVVSTAIQGGTWYTPSGGVGSSKNTIYVGENGTLRVNAEHHLAHSDYAQGWNMYGTYLQQTVTGTGTIEISSGGSTLLTRQKAAFEGTVHVINNTRLYLAGGAFEGNSELFENLTALNSATIKVDAGSQVRLTPSLRYTTTAKINSYSDFIISGDGFRGSDWGLKQSSLNAGALAIDCGATVWGNVTLAADASISSSSSNPTTSSSKVACSSSYGVIGSLGGTLRGQILGEGMTLSIKGNEGMTLTADSANTYGDLVIANGNGNNSEKFALRLNGGKAVSQVSTALGMGEVTLNDGLILRLAGTGTGNQTSIEYTYANNINAGNGATLQSYNITNKLTGTVTAAGDLNLATANGGVLHLAGGVAGSGALNLAAGSQVILGSANGASFNGNIVAGVGAALTLDSSAAVATTTSITGTDSFSLNLSGTSDYTLGGIALGTSEGVASSSLTLSFDFTNPTAEDRTTLYSSISAGTTTIALNLNMFNEIASGEYTLISGNLGTGSFALDASLGDRFSYRQEDGKLILIVGGDTRLYWSSANGTAQDWNGANWQVGGQGNLVSYGSGQEVVLGVTGLSSADSREMIAVDGAVTAGRVNVSSTYGLEGAGAIAGTTLVVGDGGDMLLGVNANFSEGVQITRGALTVQDAALNANVTLSEQAAMNMDGATVTGTVSTKGSGSGNVTLNSAQMSGSFYADSDMATLKADNIELNGGSIGSAANLQAGSITVAGGSFESTASLQADSVTAAGGSVTLKGTSTIETLAVTGGQSATLYNAAENDGSKKNISTLALADGATLKIDNRANTTSESGVIGTVQVAGTGTIQEVYGSGHLTIGTLTLAEGTTSGTLNLYKSSSNGGASYTAMFDLGSSMAAAGNFVGDVVLANTATHSGNPKHSVFINLFGQDILANAAVRMNEQKDSQAYLGLGVNVNNARIGGLESSSALGTRALLFSGYAPQNIGWNTGDGPDKNADEVARTLVIDTEAGAAFTYYGQVREMLSIVKDGEGMQTFAGNSTAFNGSIEILEGTLAFSGQALNMLSSASSVAVNGGTLDVTGFDFSTGSLAVNNLSFTEASVLALGNLQADTVYNFFDNSNGALENWVTLTTDNFSINGTSLSDMGRVTLTLGMDGSFSYTLEDSWDLVWDGGETGTWNDVSSNEVWQTTRMNEMMGTEETFNTRFTNNDNVLFNSDANLELEGNIIVNNMTVADNVSLVTKGSLSVAGDLTVGNGISWDFSGDTSLSFTEGELKAAKSIVVGDGATLIMTDKTTMQNNSSTAFDNVSGTGNVVLNLGMDNGVGFDLSGISGDITVATGRLQVNQSAFNDASTIYLATSDSQLVFNGNGTVLNNDIVLGANNTTHANKGCSGTIAGVISGNASFTKAGAGTLTFAAQNTYTGTTTISGGKLILANGGDYTLLNSVSEGTLEVANGTTLVNNGKQITSTLVLAAGSAAEMNGECVLKGAITVNNGAVLTFIGNGSDTLDWNTGNPITVDGGTIDFGNTRQTIAGWSLTLKNGAQLLGGGGSYGAAYTAALDFNNNSTINVTSGANSIAANMRLRGGDNRQLTFNVSEGASLDVSGRMHSDSATATVGNVVKNGAGSATISSQVMLGKITANAGDITVAYTGEGGNTVKSVVLSNGAELRVAEGAALNISNSSVEISGRTGTAAITTTANSATYSVSSTDVELTDAHVTYTGGDATISNKLTNSSIENAGSGTLTVDNAGNTLNGVYATGGSVKLFADAELDLQELEIATSLSVSAYSQLNESVSEEARINVSGTANFGMGVTLNADLVMKSGATLKVADTVQMGSDVRLESGLKLAGAQYDTLSSLKVGEKVTLFSGVDSLFLSNSTVASDSITLDDRVLANEYFSNLSSNYFLVFDTTAGVGQGELSIAMIPEPTTATLSLLALAGLAARRRRK